jgi:Cu2+-exporting ATPase
VPDHERRFVSTVVEPARPEVAPLAEVDTEHTPPVHEQAAEESRGRRATGGGERGGHDHADHAAAFRDRFWISLALALPVVVYSEMVQDWLGYTAPSFPGSELVAPVLGTAIFVYGGQPFLTGAVSELRARRPGMMLLVATAISVAFVTSAATTLGLFGLEFWWELAALIVIMLLGHWLEMRAIGQASSALSALAELLPDEAERLRGDQLEVVPTSALERGDLVLVRPGGRVPADGTVEGGGADLDESMISGESRPVARGPGDRVVAGTVATDSAIRVRIEAVGEDTALAGIERLVADAESSRTRTQALADRAAALLFYVAAAAAVLTLAAWGLADQLDDGVVRTVTVLVIACPHALGLAIPLVVSISTSLSARSGILVKDRLALERMREIDLVLFDKTGTLTLGAHRLTGVTTTGGAGEEDLLALAAAVESDSEHPLARAIVTAAGERSPTLPAAADFRNRSGRGVEARVGSSEVAVGGPALLEERRLGEPDSLSTKLGEWRARGAAVLYVIEDGRVVGALALEDQVRPESREAVRALHELGVGVAMLTGDAREVAHAVSRELGIDEVFAQVLPEDKDAAVTDLQRRGRTVAMVGDGVNDAPALARADVGVAIGAGTDVAIESAGIVLASDDPRGVLGVIRLSRASYRKMLQNLAWAAGYNALAIPLAAGVLAWAGITLAPAVGAILMSASTIVVALNAQLLRRFDLQPGRA